MEGDVDPSLLSRRLQQSNNIWL